MPAQRDIRETRTYREIEEHFRQAHAPAFGRISGASDPQVSPDATRIAFTGSKLDKLEGVPSSRVCVADVATGTADELTAGPNDDRSPSWSPDGTSLAFLSDRRERGVFQLYLLEAGRLGEARGTPALDGTVEYHAWSPDGRRILLGVAGRGADMAGGQGSGTTRSVEEDLPAWTPTVDVGTSDTQWRRLWLYDVASGSVSRASRDGLNVWEAAWHGNDRAAAICSEGPGEDDWYTAPLALVDVASGNETVVLRSEVQLGLPCGSPSGSRLAVVEAVCSDRWIVAGDILLAGDGDHRRVDTNGVDVTHLVWRTEDRLLWSGQRGLETVIGELDVATLASRELWVSDESCGQRYPTSSPAGTHEAAIVVESYGRPPALALVGEGQREVASFAHEGTNYLLGVSGRVEQAAWPAPDGLEIQGLLCVPDGPGPHPLVVNVHGGPVWAYRNRWSMGMSITPLLVSRGYAVLHPNPRGSSGRGQKFADMVFGDMGGADTYDYLSGVDALVERRIADRERIGVTGGSYGGFMSSWLVTQDVRFAAAVPVAPVTDWYSQHRTSNIGYFDRIFLRDDPYARDGKYFERSPVMFASRVRTPCLNIGGLLDKCTPPTQAQEFHQSLLEFGVTSELVLYPQEGHGVRQFPAVIDYSARVVGWFERFMPA